MKKLTREQIEERLKSSISGIDLSQYDLSNLDLSNLNLAYASLVGADLSDANLSRTNLYKADLREAVLYGADLQDCDLKESDMSEVQLEGPELIGAKLTGAILLNIGLEKTNLSNLDLTNVNLQGGWFRESDLTNTILKGANLSYADLQKADLRGTNLAEANLEGSILDGASYDKDTIWPEGFEPDELGAVFLEPSPTIDIAVTNSQPISPTNFLGHSGAVFSLNFDYTGQYLVSAGEDMTVRIWDVLQKSKVAVLKGHTGIINKVKISPNGKLIASAGYDCTVRIWDAITKKTLFILKGHPDIIVNLDFSPDSKWLVSSGPSITEAIWSNVFFWDLSTGKEISLFADKPDLSCVVFNPNGSSLAGSTKDGAIEIWNIVTATKLASLKNNSLDFRFLVFHPTRDILACSNIMTDSIGGKNAQVKIWDVKTCEEILSIPHPSGISSLIFTPDGRYLCTASLSQIFFWDLKSGKNILTLNNPKGQIFSVAFSPMRQQIASAGYGLQINLWDLTNILIP